MNWFSEPTPSGFSSLSVGAATEAGPVRDENQDACGHFTAEEADEERLFIVADGMGGHAGGREASTTTVEVVKDVFFGERDGTLLDRLQRAFHQANTRVYESSEAEAAVNSMGTTATALALDGQEAYIAHVGDSRAYRYRSEDAEQLTQDHTVAHELHRRGMLTEAEVRTHPKRGTLTRAVGIQSNIEVDLIEVGALRPDDRFLLCTDGLEDLSGAVLQEVVLNNPPQSACEQLVRRAGEQDGYDNATALILYANLS